jgi:superfamily II DNA or RNA helicase/uncharacterized tellurite resistance protein B-like protein
MTGRGDVLYRLLQELRLGEITSIIRHFGFAADGDKEERLGRLRDRVLDGDIPFRDVLRSAYVWQLARMCQVAGLPGDGLRHELVNRLAEWYESAMARRGRAAEAEEPEAEIPDEDLAEAQPYPDHETLATTAPDSAGGDADPAIARLRREVIEHLTEFFERDRGHAGLISMPAGSGKLRATLEWVLGRHIALGRRVLWMADRVELLNQAHDEIRRQAGALAGRRPELAVSRFDGLHGRLDGDLVLATPAALLHRGIAGRDIELNGRLALVCWDEVHTSTAARALRALRAVWPAQVPLLGLASIPASPSSPNSTRIGELFGDKPIYRRTWRELADAGLFAQPVFLHRRMHATEGEPIPLDEKAAERIRRQAADVPPEVLAWIGRHGRRSGEVVAHWLNQRERYGKTLFFACNLEHAEGLVEALRAHGVDADALHAGLADDARHRRLDRFRGGPADALVTTGLLSESDDVGDVKTVVLARPTASRIFYLQMVARGARARPGKARFFVVDCVDEFERLGVILAGRDVAASLGETFVEADLAAPPPSRIPGEGERRRRDRALVSAQAWMLLRRLAPEQYTFWGELVWELPEGGEKSIAVFVEGLPALRDAVEKVARACEVGDWSGLHELGSELDKLGALRSVDWEDMMQAVGQLGKPPRLEWAPEMQLAASSDAAARDVATLVDALLTGRLSFTDVIGQCETLIAVNPELAERFGTSKVLRQEVMALSIDVGARQARVGRLRRKREDAAGERLHKVEAFVRFAMGVSRSDDNIHEAEIRCITKAAARMFEISGEVEWELLSRLVERARTEPIDVDQLSMYLREHATQGERLAMYDWLFRIADADGVFMPEETSFLKLAGAKLGVPKEEFDELLDRYGAGIPASAAGAEEIATCPQCSETREVGSKFCVFCGYPFDLD